MKVLIVDDTPLNLKLLRAVLEGDGMSVVEAQDGAEAVSLLEAEPFDAVISDILMPRLDGYRFCQAVRKDERWKDLPFLFYSATYTSPSDEKLCYDLGGDKYLRKPCSPVVLLAALKDAVARVGRRSPPKVHLTEPEVTKEYSERLICKLEQKNHQLAVRTQQLETARAEVEQINRGLEERVRQRTSALELANQELEAFSYSVSHDLRSPLNHIGGYIGVVLRETEGQLSPEANEYLNRARTAAHRMNDLIDALLDLSRLAKTELHQGLVDLTGLALDVGEELRLLHPERNVRFEVAPHLQAHGDHRLLRVVMANLLGNAWKYSRIRAEACIEFGAVGRDDGPVFFVRDNGAGFDMEYSHRLFQAFHRLHTIKEFEGSGIGLATVRRILQRHDGEVWAESKPDQGATFYFTIGNQEAALEFRRKTA
jgi:signal transduction histidine kinase